MNSLKGIPQIIQNFWCSIQPKTGALRELKWRDKKPEIGPRSQRTFYVQLYENINKFNEHKHFIFTHLNKLNGKEKTKGGSQPQLDISGPNMFLKHGASASAFHWELKKLI